MPRSERVDAHRARGSLPVSGRAIEVIALEDDQRLLRAEEKKAKALRAALATERSVVEEALKDWHTGNGTPLQFVNKRLSDMATAIEVESWAELLAEKQAAESKLEEVAQELDERADETEQFCSYLRKGESFAYRTAAQLLRDKGTGANNFSVRNEPEEKSSITVHKGTEQGGDAHVTGVEGPAPGPAIQVAEAGVAVEGDPGLEQLLGWVEGQAEHAHLAEGLAGLTAAGAYREVATRIRELQGERGEGNA